MTIVVDTHVALWWTSEPSRLSRKAQASLKGADAIGLPSIVFWEVAMLARRGRVAVDADEWCQSVLAIPRVHEVPIDARIALLAERLEMHGDPADRFIVGAALALDVALVTRDERLRALGFLKSVW